MMTTTKLINLYEVLKESQDSFNNIAKSFIQDTSTSLEDKWNCFRDFKLGNHISWIYHTGKLQLSNTEDWEEYECGYLIRGVDRYQTVDLVDQIESLLEDYYDENNEALYTDEESNFPSIEQINEVKEIILKDYIRTFIFDW